MSAIVRWEDPPEHHGNKRPAAELKYADIAAELRAAPSKWAIVVEGLTAASGGGLANRIRTGRSGFAPRGAFQARCIGPAGGKATVYARYVGEPS